MVIIALRAPPHGRMAIQNLTTKEPQRSWGMLNHLSRPNPRLVFFCSSMAHIKEYKQHKVQSMIAEQQQQL